MAAGGAVLLCVIAYAIYAYWNGNWPFTKAEEKKVDLKDLLALNDKEVTEADYTKFKDLLESTDATNVADSNKDKFDKIKAALEAKAPQA
jgi:Tfp pilus assembly protein PilN